MLNRRHKIHQPPPAPQRQVVVTRVRVDDTARNQQDRPEETAAVYVMPATASRDFVFGFASGRAAAIPADRQGFYRVKVLAVTP